MHIFLDNFHHDGKYSAQIASHQAELRRERNFTDQKYLSISSLQTEYLNLDSSSVFGRNSERANTVQKKCTFLEFLIALHKKKIKSIRQEKEKARTAVDLDNRQTERTPRKCLDVDLKINSLQNFRSHLKRIRNGERKYVLLKKGNGHATTAKITVTKRYMHI